MQPSIFILLSLVVTSFFVPFFNGKKDDHVDDENNFVIEPIVMNPIYHVSSSSYTVHTHYTEPCTSAPQCIYSMAVVVFLLYAAYILNGIGRY